MGNKSGYSWLDAVKKAFRSPTKDHQEKRATRRREPEEEEEDAEKRGKKRWTFRRHFSLETTIHAKCSNSSAVRICTGEEALLTKLTKKENNPPSEHRRNFAPPQVTRPHDQAALLIQRVFRGYLARRALLALRGVVKLQALIRGHNVRKRAKMTLQCIQSLVRVQALVCDQRRRLSCEATTLGSSSLGVDSSELEEIRSLIHKAKECSIKQSNTLAHPFSQQIWMKNNHHRRRRSSHEQFLDSVSTSTPRKNLTLSLQSPKTPSSSKSFCYQTAETPTCIHRMSMSEKSCPIPRPNYMAATASAMARVRPSSTPRQRLSSPGRELTADYSAKKRLSFTMQDGLNAADGLKHERYRGRVGDERRSDKPYYGTD